jgi:selenide,water dikinase
MINSETVKLTQYSHGAGCGCKISPKILDLILKGNISMPDNNKLLVGNHSKDDAAVYDMGNGTALISTTDFFMPIVDDPYSFGRIASANAISDVYAMGGRPLMAIAILGWPVNVLGPEIAAKVIEGSRSICLEAGIPLAGGHSIDSPEPIYGLAVNGIVDINNIKQNNTAKDGDYLLLTKKLGVGILTTAEKKGLLQPEHRNVASLQMEQLNSIGELLGRIPGVHAMTDVTGFGLLGHLTEMCEGSSVKAEIYFEKIPFITGDLLSYIDKGAVPGGTGRNWDSYGEKVYISDKLNQHYAKSILADPQTSGGLLVSVNESSLHEIHGLFAQYGLYNEVIGRIKTDGKELISVV